MFASCRLPQHPDSRLCEHRSCNCLDSDLNGLPLAILELKNAANEDATIWSAFNQCQTYTTELPTLFAYNALLVISDGVQTRVGTLLCGREWFKPWRTIEGERLADPHLPELQVVIDGVFAPQRFLDLLRDFIVFEDAGGGQLDVSRYPGRICRRAAIHTCF